LTVSEKQLAHFCESQRVYWYSRVDHNGNVPIRGRGPGCGKEKYKSSCQQSRGESCVKSLHGWLP
jgi:hypothetical protein